MKLLYLLALSALFAVTFAGARDSDEDELVLAAVITRLCESNEDGYSVLSDTSAGVNADLAAALELNGPLTESLIRRNATPMRLPVASACARLKATRQADIDAVMRERAKSAETYRSPHWASFYKSFPGSSGTLHISRPGYSADRKQALVQVAASCDSLCGSGFFWLLRKRHDRWRVERTIPGWVE